MAPNVDQFKQLLGYGARVNLYAVELQLPTVIKDATSETQLSVLVSDIEMPFARTIEAEPIAVAGDTFHIPKDKSAEEPLKVSFRDTEDLRLRSLFELWMDVIQQDITSIRTNPDVFKAPYFVIKQLDHAQTVTRKVQIIGAWPSGMTRITFNMSEGGNSKCEVTFTFDSHKVLAI